MQSATCSVRYSPRASRAGVASIFPVLAGCAAGFLSVSQAGAGHERDHDEQQTSNNLYEGFHCIP